MLNEHEKIVLGKLAQGQTHYEIGASLGYNQVELGALLRFMQAKLGAKTLAHLMHRAWEIGLFTRTLCLCVVIVSAGHISDSKALRNNRLARSHVRITHRLQVAV